MSELVPELAAACIVLLIIALIIVARRNNRIEGDQRLAELWEWMLQQGTLPRQDLIRVARVYQRARTGTKAIIERSDQSRQDAWFAAWYPAPGTYVVVDGNVGYGPHNGNSDVLFVDRGGIVGSAPADAPAASRRHQARLQKSSRDSRK